MLFSNTSMTARAAEDYSDPMIVVSLGDSYSSGEGITPFYGQEKNVYEKIRDRDWLAHRSTKAWPSLLEVPNYGITGNHRKKEKSNDNFQWYFVASSGAVSTDLYFTKQHKSAFQEESVWIGMTPTLMPFYYSDDLPVQNDIFNTIDRYGKVDYVTMTVGGNDVGFEDIISLCVKKSTYLGSKKLKNKLDDLWANIDNTMRDLKTTYKAVKSAAGSQAAIIVAGYPKLLDKTGKGFTFSLEESTMVNNKVHDFNRKIEETVKQCRDEGMNIYFVSVEEAFDADGGHQAFSDDPWLNGVWTHQSEDINDVNPISAYSMHPNAEGAKAYARCVNAKIAQLENSKREGSLSGKVCLASKRDVAVPFALVRAKSNTRSWDSDLGLTDNDGEYSFKLEEDNYLIQINALGFIPFTAYATVTENKNTFMETFLLVAGREGEEGVAKGKIKNSITALGVPEADIEVRKGWNNASEGDVLATSKTDSNGNYTLGLPLGNYTLSVSKNGFITSLTNIIVQRTVTENQDGELTPIGSGDDFRIVLTWGENPRDLDSHVYGPLSNGWYFHVYYRDKSCYDDGEEICNLDVDDTTSYGPETITLKAKLSSPYYYYIHRYAGTGTISTSEAVVKVYQKDELIQKFNVPTGLSNGDYWNVFAIVDGQIIPHNTMGSYPDFEYAGNGINSSLRLMRVGTSFLDELLNLNAKKDGDVKEEAAASASSSIDENEAAASASSSVDENEAAASASSSEDVAAASTSGSSVEANVDSAAVSKSEDDEKSAESSSADGTTTADSSAEASSAVSSGAAASGSTSSDNAGTGSSVSEGSGSEEPNPDSASAGM
ncbi:carboxypeptidase regulatory-like domain-containing protein [Butyrivibrio sp. VCB2006]|uniref:carboxypeptidase regulatory-like domain-containing protein n=1 Tax=Butyrivibrio sp. VCB2006 TaxID=1280679 RepID=UPI0018CAA748|nr:carboxypeptidase regulatory-like domain-containing protein [Butyrivibrio sp. VCB2006]